jgi:hypothetical protein
VLNQLRDMVPVTGRDVREQAPKAVTRALRLTGAATASYLVALPLVQDRRPLTAALTALLIVQVTLVGTVTDTVRRIVSVVAGVAVAIVFSAFVPFAWWSLAAIIAASILLGQVLRLREHLLEVPISAMLILAVGGAGTQALDRVAETIIGAAVGLLVNLIFPPAIQTRTAGAAVRRAADRLADLLERVSVSLMEHQPTHDDLRGWLDDSRRVTTAIAGVDSALAEAVRSRRLNPRAVGTVDTTPDLRTGLESLEHSAAALRAVFRSIADRVGALQADVEVDRVPEEFEDDDLREALGVLMGDLAQAVRSFGGLVRAEVDEAGAPHTAEVAEALDAVREARVRLTELLLVDPQAAPGQWQLHGSLLAGIERVLAELDVEERARRRELRRREAEAARRPAAFAAERLRSTTRRVVQERPPLPGARRRARR